MIRYLLKNREIGKAAMLYVKFQIWVFCLIMLAIVLTEILKANN